MRLEYGIRQSNNQAKRIAKQVYDRIIADGGSSAMLIDLITYFQDLKIACGNLDNIVCIADPHNIGYKVGTGSGLLKLYSTQASGDLVAPSTSQEPLLLLWNSKHGNYLYGVNVPGNGCSTPDSAANSITGDIDISCKIFLKLGNLDKIVAKYKSSVGDKAYMFQKLATNKLSLYYSIDGTNVIAADSSTAVNQDQISDKYIRVTRVASTGVVKFYTSPDGSAWTQLGTDITKTAGNIYDANTPLSIGGQAALGNIQGKLYSVHIYNGIRENGGTLAVRFDVSEYNPNTPNTWVSSTGETWTHNTDIVNTGYKNILVTQNVIAFNGIDDYIRGTFNQNQPVTSYLLSQSYTFVSGKTLLDGNSQNEHRLYENYNSNSASFNAGKEIYSAVFTRKIFELLTAVADGIHSVLQRSKDVEVNGDAGSNSLTGVTVGTDGALTAANYIAMEFKCLIMFKGVHSRLQRTKIQDFIHKYHPYQVTNATPLANRIVLFGTSITWGGTADPRLTNRYGALVCAYMGYTEVNNGLNGCVLQHDSDNPITPCMYDNIENLPIVHDYDNYRYLFFEFGANDCNYYPTKTYQFISQYIEIIDEAIVHGWTIDQIKLLTCFRSDVGNYWIDYNNAIQQVGITTGCQVIDTGNQLYNGGDYAGFMSDTVHPNNAGHALMANYILNTLM